MYLKKKKILVDIVAKRFSFVHVMLWSQNDNCQIYGVQILIAFSRIFVGKLRAKNFRRFYSHSIVTTVIELRIFWESIILILNPRLGNGCRHTFSCESLSSSLN